MSSPQLGRRLTEVDLPIRTISAYARGEKTIYRERISGPAQMEWEPVMTVEHYQISAANLLIAVEPGEEKCRTLIVILAPRTSKSPTW